MASCDQCGACCKGHLIVEADELDVLREPRLIFADPHYAGQAPDEVVRRLQDEVGCCVIVACGAPCPFARGQPVLDLPHKAERLRGTSSRR